MSEFFFTLDEDDRREIIQKAAVDSGVPEDVLEKDIWLVWTLKKLFEIPNVPDMAFKGGTALSKVFGAIERFSEDVDISVNYRELATDLADADLSQMSKSAKKKASDKLRKLLTKLSHDVLVPHLKSAVDDLMSDGVCKIEVDETGEKIRLQYPSVAAKIGYLKDEVLIELGGRNPTEPNQLHHLTTEIAKTLPQFEWPNADVSVLVPTRTFWEKATLIHIECNRPEGRIGDRMFRHWYDLSRLADHQIGIDALTDIPLLERVVRHKEAFFAYSNVSYDGCLDGGIVLEPRDSLMDDLYADYKAMVAQRMFAGKAPEFQEVIGQIRALQAEINEAVTEFNKKA